MKKASFIIIFLVMNVCLYSIPDWYKNPRKLRDPSQFLVGLGEGSTLEQAQNMAKSDLIQKVSVTIRSDTDVTYIITETENKAYYEEYINRNIQTSSEQHIVGMEVVNQARVRNVWYVMVALRKTNLLSKLMTEIDDNWANVRECIVSAERFKLNGQVVFALEKYLEAQNLLSDLISKKYLYESLFLRPYDIPNLLRVGDIENFVRELISSINIELSSGNEQTAIRGELIPLPIIFEASFTKNGVREPLSSLPVKVYYGDGQEIEAGITDSKGLYSVRAVAVPNTSNRGRIVIQIDQSRFPSLYHRILEDIKCTADFTANEPPPLEMTVSAKDSKGNNIQNIQSHISQVLSSNGIIIKGNAPLHLKATASVKNSNQIVRSGRNFYTVDVNLDIELIDARNNIIGVFRATEYGQTLNGEEEAIRQAYNKINVNNSEFLDILKRAR